MSNYSINKLDQYGLNIKKHLHVVINYSHFKALRSKLVLHDLSLSAFISEICKLVYEEDDNMLAVIEELRKRKHDKIMDKLIGNQKEDVYEIINKNSPIDELEKEKK